jgi:hypothetical protein
LSNYSSVSSKFDNRFPLHRGAHHLHVNCILKYIDSIQIIACFYFITVVGVVPKHYTENQQPGCGEYSAGYNTNDGL